MKCCVGSLVPLLIVFGISHGILIIGPNKFRPNQMYSVVVTNFNNQTVNLLTTIEGTSESNGASVLNLRKSVDVRQNMNQFVDFQIPDNLPQGSYKLTFHGQRGFSYLQEVPLKLEQKSISGLIQINKPVFKPGDTVLFRVVLLNTELKPPVNVETVIVTIKDPHGTLIRIWSAVRLHVGVFENQLDLGPQPLLGVWNITVSHDGENALVSKQFEVKEYVLSTFDVEVVPSTIPLEEHKGLKLTVSAKYFSGQPVKGTAILELYVEDDTLDQSRTWEMHGSAHVKLKFNTRLQISKQHQSVRVNLTFIEQYTNRTVTKQQEIIVYKHKYSATLATNSQQFRPGKQFNCEIQLKYHDGTPAKNVAVQLTVDGLDNSLEKMDLISDWNGTIRKKLSPTDSTEQLTVTVEDDGTELLYAVITKSDSAVYLEVERKSSPNTLPKMTVKCSEMLTFLVYYIVSKGGIIDAGYIKTKRVKNYPLEVKMTNDMRPKSKIIVATLAKQTIIYDTLDIVFDDMLNNFKVNIVNKEVKPGEEINLDVRGQPGSYVALAAYDRSLLLHNSEHDLFWEDIMELYKDFHQTSINEFDHIHSLGLFAKTTENTKIGSTIDLAQRTGWQSTHHKTEKLVPYRVNFLESWLWQNVTMAASGRLNISKITPDTTTSWQVTGFAIHPVYGVGVIKKPIQITTVQPFYIVETLPYSIKRGEAVALQFTLFSNLARGQTANVTMYNVANQTEFIGCPEELSCTKSVFVLARAGAPVSFLVKSRKLGEMVVRVKATMGQDEADAIEKVIRVMPDSLVHKQMDTRIFIHDSYTNQSFKFSLNINKHADSGSQRIVLAVHPNWITPVEDNLEELINVPTGTGESNMIHFVPHVAVLDYLYAFDEKKKQTIKKATALLRQGYQNQMKYRQTDGSFGIWQAKGGSVFLTAFVANALQSASKYIPEVENGMVAAAFTWLAAQQNSSGHFDEVGSIIHQELQGRGRNNIALTSYVLIAFMENVNAKEAHGSVITKGIEYVERHLEQVTDTYDLSIATYALVLHDPGKSPLLKKLIEASTAAAGGVERYWSTSHSVETTAYALLALIEAKKYSDGIAPMRWLAKQRYVTGSFPRTQDTFVGLKALTKLTESLSTARNDYTIQVSSKPNRLQTFKMSPQDKATQAVDIPSDARVLNVNVAGRGFGVIDVRYEYALNLQNSNHRFDLTLKRSTDNANYELRLEVCASFIPHLTEEWSNQALVEVNFPSGYVVDNDPITDATTFNPIKKTEVRFGATSVVVYYDNMGRELNCFNITAYRRFDVRLRRPAHVFVHDFYKKEWHAIQVYKVE